jgi:hypothetical protein
LSRDDEREGFEEKPIVESGKKVDYNAIPIPPPPERRGI